MGFRFRKSIKIGKHFRVNLSSKGVGYSVGGKGFRYTKTAAGKSYNTYNIPGTGISYRQDLDGNASDQLSGSSERPVKPQKVKKNGNKIAAIVFGVLLVLMVIGFFANSEGERGTNDIIILAVAAAVFAVGMIVNIVLAIKKASKLSEGFPDDTTN